MKTYSVCLELEALSFVVKIFYEDGVSGDFEIHFGFSLPGIIC